MRRIVIGGMAGAVAGIGVFTFDYGEGLSYLGHDPKSCINCHIMQPEFDSWQHAGHHHAATCQDCHVPHDSLLRWVVSEADNGFRHSKGFTLQDFVEPIRITAQNSQILQENCLRCHGDFVESILPGSRSAHADSGIRCVHCHAGVGHGQRYLMGRDFDGRDARIQAEGAAANSGAHNEK